jgi:Cu(I)/Ag(I) efflux system membrane fusion protein/cobalt-zinc-cadmium efflux system membrane fusion protein
MTNNQADEKSAFPLRVVAMTAILTLLLAGGGAYFSGYLGPRGSKKALPDTEKIGAERKIAYWKAPMNPTEIYDNPGKSAMGMDLVPVYEDEVTGKASKGDTKRKIAYWKAPMNPAEIYDNPGKSAMGMDLVPVYEDELVGGVEVKVDPVIQQNMGIRTAVVEKGPLIGTIRTYGHVTYDETHTAEISTKISGWIEKIHIDFTGKFVKKGQPLFELYSPQLFAAQEEYLATFRNLNRMSDRSNEELLKAARKRLQYFDIAADEIQAMERSSAVK